MVGRISKRSVRNNKGGFEVQMIVSREKKKERKREREGERERERKREREETDSKLSRAQRNIREISGEREGGVRSLNDSAR
jgi:hypothetical protein